MRKQISLKNNEGKVQKVSLGYSYTTFFFNFIPDLIRFQFGSTILYVFINVLPNLLIEHTQVTSALIGAVTLSVFATYAYFRNKVLIDLYLKQGYKFVDLEDKEQLEEFLGRELQDNQFIEEIKETL